MYARTARPIVDAVMEGYNGTVLAYGQTGTGKTYAMEGLRDIPDERGIIPNSFEQIFSIIGASSGTDKQYLVRCTYIEIYMDAVRDLLAEDPKKKCDLRQKVSDRKPKSNEREPAASFYVDNVSEWTATSVQDIDRIMAKGNANRTVGATNMNAHSSRSHAIFSITVECSQKSEIDGKPHVRVGKLNLVDLAGSERQNKTQATGARLKEASNINKGLLVLGLVIKALVANTLPPIRDSSLTKLLSDSLGGNSKTVMIATLGPADYNYEETHSTIKYANTAKEIKNTPTVNEDPKDAQLRKYQEEIENLRKALSQQAGGKGIKTKREKRKVVKKVLENGQVVEESYEDDTSTQVEDMDPAELAKMEAEVEAEKKRVISQKGLLEEEKKKLLADLETRAQDIEKEKKSREEMAKKLSDLNEKMLVGGVNIFQHVNEQERLAKQKALEIEEKERQNLLLQKKMEEQTLFVAQLEGTYNTVAEKIQGFDKKIKKVTSKIAANKAELSNVRDEFRNDRESLLDRIRDLQNNVAVYSVIIDNFIPVDILRKLSSRLYYDEGIEKYLFKPTEVTAITRPRITDVLPRPMSKTARQIISKTAAANITVKLDTSSQNLTDIDATARYRPENILHVAMDMPDKNINALLSGNVIPPSTGQNLTTGIASPSSSTPMLKKELTPELSKLVNRSGLLNSPLVSSSPSLLTPKPPEGKPTITPTPPKGRPQSSGRRRQISPASASSATTSSQRVASKPLDEEKNDTEDF